PTDPAAVFIETAAGNLTYGEVDGAVSRIANLLEDLGAAKGERVVAQTEKSPQAVLLYLACLKAGAIYIPPNTAYTEGEIDYFLRDAEPVLFVCDPTKAHKLGALARTAGVPHVLTLDAQGEGSLSDGARGQRASAETAMVAASDIAAILYTSGTTGRPK